MKKKIFNFILAICLILPCSLLFISCGKNDNNSNNNSTQNNTINYTKFTTLEQNQTLNIGTTLSFKNNQSSKTENYYLEYLNKVTFVLCRSSYQIGTESVLYDGYYYYWDYETEFDNELVGTQTTTVTTTYSYLIYGENEHITVKSTTETAVTNDFNTKMISKAFTTEYQLFGYFASITELATACPELVKQLPTTTTIKHLIPTPETTYSYTEDTYRNTYFYFS